MEFRQDFGVITLVPINGRGVRPIIAKVLIVVLHYNSITLCLLSCKDREVSQQYVSLGFFTIKVKVTTSCRVKKSHWGGMQVAY